MSAIVCGKRSFFEDLPTSPISKKIRSSSSSSTSPIRFSPPRPTTTTTTTTATATSTSTSPSYSFFSAVAAQSSLIDHLIAIFPDMEKQVIERALEECGDDLDSAIKSLYKLRLGSDEANLCCNDGIASESNVRFQPPGVTINGEIASAEDRSAPKNLPMDGGDWVELFVREMMSASDMDDARARASKALEVLEKSIIARAGVEASVSLSQDNMMLREKAEAMIQENTVLKRAVSIQHERQREFEDRNQEVQHLKQMVSQYQEQLRTLEVNNYALTMHLRQAQQSSSIPGRFHPDVF